MTHKPYLINSIIGNGKMLATLGENSEIYRIFWPHIDNYQHLRNSFGGVCVWEGTWWFVDPSKWEYNQSYLPDSNVVKTILFNDATQLEVTIYDFVEPKDDVLIRHFEISNKSNNPLPVKFLYFAAFNMQNNFDGNAVIYSPIYDALVHYRKGYHFAVGASRESHEFQCGNAFEDGHDAHLNGAVLSMDQEGAQLWNLGILEGQEKESITVYLCPGYSIEEAGDKLLRQREKGHENLLQETFDYWKDYLAKGRQVKTKSTGIDNLYRRSLLACGLLCDRENGGIIAAPELDEQYHKSGGYGYCWPRDGVFVADAMARAGYKEFAERFYLWAVKAQLPNGEWFQRYDTEGNLAPGWGTQIDETGSVIWGMWQYYLLYEDEEFIKQIWPTVLKGAEFLVGFIDKETGLPKPSFDLWEERVGEHAYSAAAVYGGLMGAAEIAKRLNKGDLIDKWQKLAIDMAQAIKNEMWDSEKKCFIRTVKKVVGHGEYEYFKSIGERVFSYKREKDYINYQVRKDDTVDISLLGLVYPFEVFSPADETITSTVQWIERVLSWPRTGGIKRYENDHYIGGNPWINTTLWLAIYYVRVQKFNEAKHLVEWAVNHRTKLDLLPEQVDRHTGDPAWIIPLTWSHAIFILAVLELLDSGQF